jgi:hypothetical protein
MLKGRENERERKKERNITEKEKCSCCVLITLQHFTKMLLYVSSYNQKKTIKKFIFPE